MSLVIFDLDGTLVDSRRDIAASVNHMLGVYNVPLLPLEVIERYVGSGAENLVRRSMGEAAARFDIAEAVRAFRAHYLDHCLDTTRAFPGIPGLLSALKDRGVSLAVVTNKPTAMMHRILGGLDLARFFDVVLGGDDVAAMKPDAGPARQVLSRTGTKPEQALMVGDSAVDVAFARSAGMKCVVVGYGGISEAEEVANAGADFICETPEKLRGCLDHMVNEPV
ncbi:MAG: HAD-IA family hydrolase [Deltaproteobacteria bacterium]|nr:HAD-IA family hydrolase [Deltaproteobacteria bacterium]